MPNTRKYSIITCCDSPIWRVTANYNSEPGGMYCSSTGLTEPVGACSEGYYCTSGVDTDTPSFASSGSIPLYLSGFQFQVVELFQAIPSLCLALRRIPGNMRFFASFLLYRELSSCSDSELKIFKQFATTSRNRRRVSGWVLLWGRIC